MEKLKLKREITGICRKIKLESDAILITAIRDAEHSATEYG